MGCLPISASEVSAVQVKIIYVLVIEVHCRPVTETGTVGVATESDAEAVPVPTMFTA